MSTNTRQENVALALEACTDAVNKLMETLQKPDERIVSYRIEDCQGLLRAARRWLADVLDDIWAAEENTDCVQSSYSPDTEEPDKIEWWPASWEDMDGYTNYWYVVDNTDNPDPIAICPPSRGKKIAEAICDYKQQADYHWGAADEAERGAIERRLFIITKYFCINIGAVKDCMCPACMIWRSWQEPSKYLPYPLG